MFFRWWSSFLDLGSYCEEGLFRTRDGQAAMEWLKPSSSSALLKRAWNKGWFKLRDWHNVYLLLLILTNVHRKNPFDAEVGLLFPATETPRVFFAAKKASHQSHFLVDGIAYALGLYIGHIYKNSVSHGYVFSDAIRLKNMIRYWHICSCFFMFH